MSLVFRNLTTKPEDPVDTWPAEAVLTALERGDIDDWRRLAVEIRRHPWGRTARQVEEILTSVRPYGVAELMEAEVERARRQAEEAERKEIAAEVRASIAASGLSRAEFASSIGTSASRLSTYATGRVTPSAAMMLRIRSLAEGARQSVSQHSGQGPSHRPRTLPAKP